MPLDQALGVAGNRLAIAGECHRRDLKRGLLAHLPDHRFLQGFAQFDAAPGQRVDAMRRRSRAAHDQDAVAAEYGRADRQIWPGWINPRGLVVHRWRLLHWREKVSNKDGAREILRRSLTGLFRAY